MKNNSYKQINSLNDLRQYKEILKKKAKKKEKKLIKRAENLKDAVTPQNVFKEVLNGLNVDNNLISYIPLIFEYGKPVLSVFKNISFKKLFFPLLGGVGAGILAYFISEKNKKTQDFNNVQE